MPVVMSFGTYWGLRFRRWLIQIGVIKGAMLPKWEHEMTRYEKEGKNMRGKRKAPSISPVSDT